MKRVVKLLWWGSHLAPHVSGAQGACVQREREMKRERERQECWAKQRKICTRQHGRHTEQLSGC